MATILVIDDDDQVRAVFRNVLERAGYQVLEARNGAEGLRLFRQASPALVITDVLMPNTDGLEVTRAVHHEAPMVPIIVLTGGVGDLNFLDAAKLMGASRIMQKPVMRAELLEAVQAERQAGAQCHQSPSPGEK
jgi:two-component system response regulator (stage 0 sporulation protein F)